jgi:hypothetical protein
MQPCQRPFDHPPRAAQSATVGSAPLGQLTLDATAAQFVAVRLRVVPPVALDYPRFPERRAGPTAHRRNGIHERQQFRYVVPVRRREPRDNRNPVRVGKNMMFRPGLAAIGRVRSSFFPPRSARSDELSTMARARSSWPWRRNSSSSTRWRRFQTPARCHRTRRRQHVLPEPHPISRGSMFQGRPLRKTKRMPVKTARSGIGFRPAYCRLRGRRLGSRRSIRAHKSSVTKVLVMSDRLAVGQATVPSLRPKYKRSVS